MQGVVRCWPLTLGTYASAGADHLACAMQVLTTTQLAQHIVRCWPFTPDPMALLELAAQQGSLHRSNSLPTEVVAGSVALDQGLQLIRYAEDLHLPHEMGRHIPFVQLHLELA